MKPSADGCGCFPTGRHYAGIAHLLRVEVVGVCEEVAVETPWADLPIVLIDVETTGRDPAVDRIVEIGLILGKNGAVVSRHNFLVNPCVPIPEEVQKVHGITDEQVAGAPKFADVAREIARLLEGSIPAAYNAAFDRQFLHEEMRRAGVELGTRLHVPPALRHGIEWIDPLVWARHLHRDEKSKSLGEVAQRVGVKLENAHRASDDAEAALFVMYAFASDERVPKSYGGLIREQKRLARLQDDELRVWRKAPP